MKIFKKKSAAAQRALDNIAGQRHFERRLLKLTSSGLSHAEALKQIDREAESESASPMASMIPAWDGGGCICEEG